MKPWERDWNQQQEESPDPGIVVESTVEAKPWEQFPETKRTPLQEAARQAGLFVRHGIEGLVRGAETITLAPLMTADVNRNLRSAGNAVQLSTPSEYTSRKLTELGLPVEETPTERVVGEVNRSAVGAATTLGLGSLTQPASGLGLRLKEVLLDRPASQIVAAASGGASGQIAQESGASPWVQTGARIIGAMAPGIAFDAARAGVRRFFRGGDAQGAQSTYQTFRDAGTTPTAAQLGQKRAPQAAESTLSKTPFAGGVIARKAEEQQAQIGQKVRGVADNLKPNADVAMAGRQIEKGVTGSFVPKFKQAASKLYDEVDQFIAPDAQVSVANTVKTLDDLSSLIQGAEETSKQFLNSRLMQIRGALATDLAKNKDGTLPYLALKKLRTLVGDLAADPALVNDVPRSQIRQVYGAMTSDMHAAAQAAGPKAVAALDRANKHWAAGMERIDSLSSVVGAKTHEAVYAAALRGSDDGGTRLTQVMRSIPVEDRKTVTAVVIKGLGRAINSQQNEAGDVFSTQTFLTNWNKLSPLAKQQIFSDASVRKSMDSVASVASNIREGSKVYANPSGTGQAVASLGGAGAILIPALTGNPGTSAAVAGGLASGYLAAKLLTYPNFVNWLAVASKAPANQAPILLNQLVRTGQTPEEREAFSDYASQVLGKPQQQKK